MSRILKRNRLHSHLFGRFKIGRFIVDINTGISRVREIGQQQLVDLQIRVPAVQIAVGPDPLGLAMTAYGRFG
jgi:hypothetical protein